MAREPHHQSEAIGPERKEMSTTDLLGDKAPEPLPAGTNLRYFEDLVGHTILAVFEGRRARRGAQLVIVTETKCWLTAHAEPDGDSPYIAVPYGIDGQLLSDYVRSNDLFETGCINAGEFEVLRKAEEESDAADRERQKNLLRQRLAALEQA